MASSGFFSPDTTTSLREAPASTQTGDVVGGILGGGAAATSGLSVILKKIKIAGPKRVNTKSSGKNSGGADQPTDATPGISITNSNLDIAAVQAALNANEFVTQQALQAHAAEFQTTAAVLAQQAGLSAASVAAATDVAQTIAGEAGAQNGQVTLTPSAISGVSKTTIALGVLVVIVVTVIFWRK